jgi:hypothetical protein
MFTKQKGLTFVELIIVLSLMALVSVPLIRILNTTLKYWQTSKTQLKSTLDVHYLLTSLIEKLSTTQSVIDISNMNNELGYIKFKNKNGDINTIFLNTIENQEQLSAINFFKNNDIVYQDHEGAFSSLISNVLVFELQSFGEVRQEGKPFIRIVSANNIGNTPFDEINSIRFIIQTDIDGHTELLEQLVDLSSDMRASTGSLEFGTEDQSFENTEDQSYDIENLDITVDSNGLTYLNLTPTIETVKILNTGQYFTSITGALNEAVSGDIILVASKEDEYTENIIIPEGVSLLGGYDPITWQYDPDLHKTKLNAQIGFLFEQGIIIMNSNTILDGFSINGQNLEYGIYGNNVNGAQISNNEIYNLDVPIFFQTGENIHIYGNTVTTNKSSLVLHSIDNGTVVRNRFKSNNLLLKDNVIINEGSNILFANNLITNGYYSFKAKDTLQLTIVNNTFFNAYSASVVLRDLPQGIFRNNAIIQNNLGLILFSNKSNVMMPPDIQYNFFLNNSYQDAGFNLDATNITDTLSNEELNTLPNKYYVDLIDFELVNNPQLSQVSPLIDAGMPNVAYNEDFIDKNPSHGTLLNDIGLYGGPYAGRVGYPTVVPIDFTSLSNAIDIWESTFPGDVLTLNKGDFNITSRLTVKPYQVITGKGVFSTKLNNMSGTNLFNVSNYSFLTNFAIESTENNAITAYTTDSFLLRNIFFKGESSSITVSTGLAKIQYASFFSVSNPILITTGANLKLSHSIIENAQTGITNQSNNTANADYNIFTNLNLAYSGSVNETNNVVSETSVFWDTDKDLFILKPSSNAIEIDSVRDAGAVEFYEQKGSILLPQLTSNVNRFYSTIELSFRNDPEKKSAISAIFAEFIDDNTSTIIDDYTIIDTETITSNIMTLPNNIIGNSIYLKLHIYSYTFNHTPIIDTIKVSW